MRALRACRPRVFFACRQVIWSEAKDFSVSALEVVTTGDLLDRLAAQRCSGSALGVSAQQLIISLWLVGVGPAHLPLQPRLNT